MTERSRVVGNFEWPGSHIFSSEVDLPDDCITEDHVAAAAVFPHTNLVHRLCERSAFGSTATVEAVKEVLHFAYRDETVLEVAAVAYAVPTSTGGSTATYSASFDVLKSTGGSTGTSILTAPITISSTCSNRTPIIGTLSGTPTLKDGNILIGKWAVAGSTGVQAKGGCGEVHVAQDPSN